MHIDPDPEGEFETLYDSGHRADFASARDVLAFVLTPPSAFILNRTDPEEHAAVAELLLEAKEEAIKRWHDARGSKPSRRCPGGL